jgi:hypothetical protein
MRGREFSRDPEHVFGYATKDLARVCVLPYGYVCPDENLPGKRAEVVLYRKSSVLPVCVLRGLKIPEYLETEAFRR